MDVDRVTARQLERLPGIGPSRAAAIVAHRETRAFERPQMLEGVPGIGPALRRKLEPWLAFPSSHRGGEGDD
jgi:competence protein ComEA